MNQLWRISYLGITFAVISQDGEIVEAAPVGRWAVGRPLGDVLAYYMRRQGTTIERLIP